MPNLTSTISRRTNSRLILLILLLLPLTGCKTLMVNNVEDRIFPSNSRQWKPEFATIAHAQIDGSRYTIRNIRNCQYITADDYVVDFYDRQIMLEQIQSVDYIVAPFNERLKLAHTMLSFGLDDGTQIALSVEIRREKDEDYDALAGFSRQYELIYVLGDEQDVIRLRTQFYDTDVFVYQTVATPSQAQAMFANVIKRVNQLAERPEFYNTLTNNCTTNLAKHVNELSPNKIDYNWKVLLPGLSAEYAYELGLLDTRVPFDELKRVALINPLADQYSDGGNFSQLIRSQHDRIDRYAERHQNRQQTLKDGNDSLKNGPFQRAIGRQSTLR